MYNPAIMKKKNSQLSRADPAISLEKIEKRIFLFRGHKVMIDRDLAELYQVPTFRLNEQVKRNAGRFPEDFMFQLSREETESLKSQFAMSKKGRGGRRTLPYAFTEHGVAMLSSVLNSERAVQMNILVIRVFVKIREILSAHKDLAARLEQIESNQSRHASVINLLAEEIKHLKRLPPAPPRRRIGFRTGH